MICDQLLNEYPYEFYTYVIGQYCNKKPITSLQLEFVLRSNAPFLPHTIIYHIIYQEPIEKLLEKDFSKNVAVISFYDSSGKTRDVEYKSVDYSAKTNSIF